MLFRSFVPTSHFRSAFLSKQEGMSSQRPVEVVPVFMSAIHGDRDKEFRKTAPSRGVIKEGRREQTLCCTKCGRWDENEGVKLRQCIGVCRRLSVFVAFEYSQPIPCSAKSSSIAQKRYVDYLAIPSQTSGSFFLTTTSVLVSKRGLVRQNFILWSLTH